MDIFKKVAIIQIRTPFSIHLLKTEGYNQTANETSQRLRSRRKNNEKECFKMDRIAAVRRYDRDVRGRVQQDPDAGDRDGRYHRRARTDSRYAGAG